MNVIFFLFLIPQFLNYVPRHLTPETIFFHNLQNKRFYCFEGVTFGDQGPAKSLALILIFLDSTGGVFDAVDNTPVSGAAAKIAGNGFYNLRSIGIRIFR